MTQHMKWMTAVVVFSAIPIAYAGQAAKVDVTGAWLFTVESALGTGTPTVTLKQEGEKLTGHYSSMLFGEAELTGTIKSQAFEFTVHAEIEGMKIDLKYTGTVDGKDAMKGKVSAGELGDGTFTAKRK
jgi:hypothetical protein